jgi:hypothetical protein
MPKREEAYALAFPPVTLPDSWFFTNYASVSCHIQPKKPDHAVEKCHHADADAACAAIAALNVAVRLP